MAREGLCVPCPQSQARPGPLAQVLLSVHSGSSMLRGSSLGRGPRSPSPFWGCRKLCLLIRGLPFRELSKEKASGVSDARSSSEEEEGARLVAEGSLLGLSSTWLLLSASGSGTGMVGAEWAGGSSALVGGTGSVRLGWATLSGAAGTAPGLAASGAAAGSGSCQFGGGSGLPPGGLMLSLAIVAWMELMGMSPPSTRSCGS